MKSVGGLITGHFAEYQIGRQALIILTSRQPHRPNSSNWNVIHRT